MNYHIVFTPGTPDKNECVGGFEPSMNRAWGLPNSHAGIMNTISNHGFLVINSSTPLAGTRYKLGLSSLNQSWGSV